MDKQAASRTVEARLTSRPLCLQRKVAEGKTRPSRCSQLTPATRLTPQAVKTRLEAKLSLIIRRRIQWIIKNAIRNLTSAALIFGAIGFSVMTPSAQEQTPDKKPVVTREDFGPRIPFKSSRWCEGLSKRRPAGKRHRFSVRIDRYFSGQKLAAEPMDIAPPKPTSS